MKPETAPALVAALGALLERERAALLSGRLDNMAPLLEEKTALCAALGDLNGPAHDDLDRLKQKAARNHALLDGALRGLRQAAGRIATLRQLRHGCDTYDESGHRHRIGGEPARRMEKRA